jgi:hypothetical protein
MGEKVGPRPGRRDEAPKVYGARRRICGTAASAGELKNTLTVLGARRL